MDTRAVFLVLIVEVVFALLYIYILFSLEFGGVVINTAEFIWDVTRIARRHELT